MIGADVIYASVAAEEVKISEHELAARLCCYCSSSPEGVRRLMGEVCACAHPAYCYVKVPVAYPRAGVVSVDGKEIVSAGLLKNLGGAREAYLLCVTLGAEVDRFLRRLSVRSGAAHFMADAIASALAEALCEYADGRIRNGETLGARFSPGYGDLPLYCQPDILKRLNAERLLGITLTDAMLMLPTKSITAIIGVKND